MIKKLVLMMALILAGLIGWQVRDWIPQESKTHPSQFSTNVTGRISTDNGTTWGDSIPIIISDANLVISGSGDYNRGFIDGYRFGLFKKTQLLEDNKKEGP